MGDWPLLRNSLAIEDDTAFSTYFQTVTGGGANAKGSYTQLVSSLARSVSGIILQARGNSAAYMLLDISIGGAGSETVVVPNVGINVANSGDGESTVFIPLSIPAGSRVAVRVQGGGAGATTQVKALFVTDTFVGLQPISSWKDWGADLTTSHGTTITANAAANVKGAYTQLVAATEFTTKWLCICIEPNNTPRNFSIDLSIGAAASEQVIIPDLLTTNNSLGYRVGPFPFSIPGGSRIAARCACSTGGSIVFVHLIGGA